jgi:uncharacterized protein YfbU (UPF0304 family)
MSLKLSDGERLILFMLGEIYKKLKVEGEIDPDFLTKAVAGGHDWAISTKYSGLFPSSPDDQNDVRETHDILTMFRLLTTSYERLSAADKKRVDTDVPPFSGKDLKFEGFDGNHDNHHSIANFMVSELGQYDELKGHAMNSHSSVLDAYRRMFKAYEPFLLSSSSGFTADQLIAVLKARVHPSRR